MKPEEDIYYYRFLLKLSLDPELNWWAKFHREAQAHLGGGPRPPSPLRDQARSQLLAQQRSGTMRAAPPAPPPDTAHVPAAWAGSASFGGGGVGRDGGGGGVGINASRQRSGAGATPSGRGPQAASVPAGTQKGQRAAFLTSAYPPGSINNAPSDVTLSAVETARAAREAVLQNQAALQNQQMQYSTPARGRQAQAPPTIGQHPQEERAAAATQLRQQQQQGGGAGGGAAGMRVMASNRAAGGGGDDESDWGGSDAEAYVDFQRTAKTFRMWRSHAFAIKESRWEPRLPFVQLGHIPLLPGSSRSPGGGPAGRLGHTLTLPVLAHRLPSPYPFYTLALLTIHISGIASRASFLIPSFPPTQLPFLASRETREAAVENWGIALSFWEVHLAQRCLMRWAGHKQRVLAAVTQRWTSTSLSSSFRSGLD